MKVIIVTGTPGTGKTTFAKKLAKLRKYKCVNVNYYISKHKLYDSIDKKRKTKVVDSKKLASFLLKFIKNLEGKEQGVVIDSHLSHYLPAKKVNICYVTKCDIAKLKKRLQKRGYNKQKIRENLDAEIFETCITEARKKGHKISIIDTT